MRNEIDRWAEKHSVVESGCWEWHASTYRGGYGHFRRKINGKWVMYKAHRFAYETFVGPIPEGHKVLHKCDNPPCVNFTHLFTGTAKDNSEDKVSKGRHKYGRNKKHQHLTKDMVDEMRRQWWVEDKCNEMSQKDFASSFGISTAQTCRVLNNKIWSH